MTPSETQRFRLRERLGELLKDEDVRTLMESLPPVDWHELASKEDLAALEECVNGRFDAGLAGVRGEMRAMDARFDALRVELGARVDKGLAGVHGEMAHLRGEFKRDVARQTYVILAGLAAIITPIYIALLAGG